MFETLTTRIKISLVLHLNGFDKKLLEEKLRTFSEIEFVSEGNEFLQCFSYALNVHFAHPFLVEKVLSETKFNETPNKGDNAWYFFGGRAVHAGVYDSTDKIISKWGNGFIYKHSLWSVPLGYGARVKYAPAPNRSFLSEIE